MIIPDVLESVMFLWYLSNKAGDVLCTAQKRKDSVTQHMTGGRSPRSWLPTQKTHAQATAEGESDVFHSSDPPVIAQSQTTLTRPGEEDARRRSVIFVSSHSLSFFYLSIQNAKQSDRQTVTSMYFFFVPGLSLQLSEW